MRSVNRLILIFGMALVCTGAWAHHSFAMFDAAKSVTLNGTIKDIQWVNPHSWIQLIAKDSSDNEVEWSIETGGPAELYRAGWRKSAIKSGDRIIIVIHPLRDGRAGGSLVSATLADGTVLEARGPAPAATSASAQPAAPSP